MGRMNWLVVLLILGGSAHSIEYEASETTLEERVKLVEQQAHVLKEENDELINQVHEMALAIEDLREEIEYTRVRDRLLGGQIEAAHSLVITWLDPRQEVWVPRVRHVHRIVDPDETLSGQCRGSNQLGQVVR